MPQFKHALKNIAFKYFYNFKSRKIFSPIFSKTDVSELKQLGHNKDLIVCKPDKGKGMVLLDKSVYIDKMQEIICNSSKFVLINESVNTYVIKIETKINNLLRKLKK